jgi:hypothetical protein
MAGTSPAMTKKEICKGYRRQSFGFVMLRESGASSISMRMVVTGSSAFADDDKEKHAAKNTGDGAWRFEN